MTRSTLLAVAGALTIMLSGCASTSAPATVAETAAKRPELSTLNRLIADAGLTDTLKGVGPYTVFAPNDDAFKAVPAKTLSALAANKELLKSVLSYHVVPGKLVSADVTNKGVKSVQGADLALSKSGAFVTVEDAMVIEADVPASNGVVHVIDRVLMPPK
jgi:uncharacterized surface protein with fasciclin (FAS1) repeats